jgi:hypothetical protein
MDTRTSLPEGERGGKPQPHKRNQGEEEAERDREQVGGHPSAQDRPDFFTIYGHPAQVGIPQVKDFSLGASRPPRLILPTDFPRGTGPLRITHEGLVSGEGGMVSNDLDIWRKPCMSQAGIPPRSIGEANSQGDLGPIVSYEELIVNMARVARARSAPASPESPRTQYQVPESKKTIGTQAQTQETTATDSDKSEPRLADILIRKFDGLQHKLQAMTQGFKEIVRSRKWAQKAHARPERRRAGKQKEVGNRPQPPVDYPQKKPDVEGNGSV